MILTILKNVLKSYTDDILALMFPRQKSLDHKQPLLVCQLHLHQHHQHHVLSRHGLNGLSATVTLRIPTELDHENAIAMLKNVWKFFKCLFVVKNVLKQQFQWRQPNQKL